MTSTMQESELREPTAVGLPLLLRNFNGIQEFNYSIHISEEFNFIFFNNPKCACSTTKATLNLECARRLGVELSYSSAHDGLVTPPPVQSPEGTEADRHATLHADARRSQDRAVLRAARAGRPILSAFASKFARNSPQRQRFNARLGRPAEAQWDIDEFVATITSDAALRDCDEHWRLQFKQVCGALVDHTIVGFQENLEASLLVFAQTVFGADRIDIYDVRKAFPHNRSDGARLQSGLSPKSRELLLKAYADDGNSIGRKGCAWIGGRLIRPRRAPQTAAREARRRRSPAHKSVRLRPLPRRARSRA